MNILLIQIAFKLTQPIVWQTESWSTGTAKISFATCNSVFITTFCAGKQRSIPHFYTFHVVP